MCMFPSKYSNYDNFLYNLSEEVNSRSEDLRYFISDYPREDKVQVLFEVAAYKTRFKIWDVLIEFGAKVSGDPIWKTPLRLACGRRGILDLAYLVSRGYEKDEPTIFNPEYQDDLAADGAFSPEISLRAHYFAMEDFLAKSEKLPKLGREVLLQNKIFENHELTISPLAQSLIQFETEFAEVLAETLTLNADILQERKLDLLHDYMDSETGNDSLCDRLIREVLLNGYANPFQYHLMRLDFQGFGHSYWRNEQMLNEIKLVENGLLHKVRNEIRDPIRQQFLCLGKSVEEYSHTFTLFGLREYMNSFTFFIQDLGSKGR